jgi:hypothetical protein
LFSWSMEYVTYVEGCVCSIIINHPPRYLSTQEYTSFINVSKEIRHIVLEKWQDQEHIRQRCIKTQGEDLRQAFEEGGVFGGKGRVLTESELKDLNEWVSDT